MRSCGFSAREVAEALGTTVASVNSSLQRARKTVAEQLPEQSQQAAARALGDEGLQALVRSYMQAMERGDIPAVVALLTEDATWSMPPFAEWYRGLGAITVFLSEHALHEVSWRHLPTHASGQPAVGCYMLNDERGRYELSVIDVLTLEGARIAAVTAFLTPEVYRRFGLPESLPLRDP